MAEESEKRFHAVMDKLFQAPSSPPPNSNSKSSTNTASTSLSGGGLLRDKKRPHTMTNILESKGVEELRSASSGTMEAPMCRPWDRGDLLKRLATFKSMTWFAKPEVVNAINCARRGWVNVDMDIIACESCGARLLFSTPSSWAQQQVEKAALVFSLKLNSGHKLLCPWVDNACDEKLAQFPPSSLADLVDSYKKRCASLLQLSSLPVISSSAIDYMRSPQLEHFLKSPSTLERADKSVHVSVAEYPDGYEVFSLYYQAQKLISLCGWEPRLLPYVVDCKGLQDKFATDGNRVDPSATVSNARTPSITLYPSGSVENTEANEVSAAADDQYDPASVVLDCGFCGASVGLWTFCTTPRPIECIRFVGHSEINYEDRDNTNHTSMVASGIHTESGQHVASTDNTGTISSNGKLLNLTIAGGPPPAEQNFRPKISLPVVGQNLRSRFSSAFESRYTPMMEVRDDNGGHIPLEGANVVETEVPAANQTYPTTSNPPENTNETIQSSSIHKKTSEDLASIETANPVAGDLSSSDVGSSSQITHGAEKSTHGAEKSTDFISSAKSDEQVIGKGDGVQTMVQSTTSNPSYLGKDQKQQSAAKSMEFDPIRQHRHFCPWVSSSGKSAPGWKQTLSALERQKEFFYPSTEQASSSLIEVDDPVGSVKKLLTPPSAKRKKLTHGTS